MDITNSAEKIFICFKFKMALAEQLFPGGNGKVVAFV